MANYLELTEQLAARNGEVINNTAFDVRKVISGTHAGKYVCVENAFKIMPEIFKFTKPNVLKLEDSDFLEDISDKVKIQDKGKEAAFIGLNIEIRIGSETKYIQIDPKEGYTQAAIETAIKQALNDAGIKG